MSILSSIRTLLFGDEHRREAAPAVSAPRRGGVYVEMPGGNPMSVATVYRCVRLLSDSVAQLPLRSLRKTRHNIFEAETFGRLHDLLEVEPMPTMSAFDFWRQVVQQLLLEGNAYIVPYRGVSMEVEQLLLCCRGTVSHDTINDRYTVNDATNGIYGEYDEDEIIHIKGQSIDGKHGLSVLEWARMSLGIAMQGDSETLKRFANGGNVYALVTNDTSVRGFGEYQDDELAKTAQDLDARFRSGERFVNVPGQTEVRPLTLSSTDMQFLESRKFTVREICRFFGVHPSFVFDDTSNNYKSAEMANVAFLSMTLNPLLRAIENELQRKLVPRVKWPSRRIEFDRRQLYACDLESRASYQSQTIAMGLYSVNDWRIEENRPPVAGGDRVFVSANLKGIDEGPATPKVDSNE